MWLTKLRDCVAWERPGHCQEKPDGRSAAVGSQRDDGPLQPQIFICELTGQLSASQVFVAFPFAQEARKGSFT